MEDLFCDDVRLKFGYGGIVDYYGEYGILWGCFWMENFGMLVEVVYIC